MPRSIRGSISGDKKLHIDNKILVIKHYLLIKSFLVVKGGGGSDSCRDFSGGFDKVQKGQPKVIIDP